MKEIICLFPKELQEKISLHLAGRWDILQEIRIRLLQPVELIFDQDVEWIIECIPTKQTCHYMLNQLSEHSLYRLEDELREGYITIRGGHRIGLAGKVNTLNGAVKAIQYITFLNIRIAKEKKGVALPIIPYLYEEKYYNTLLIGPPQTGKTTLLRDLSRLIATGWRNVPPKKIGVIDERSEIGASIEGLPQHDLGLRSDVLDACPKAEGMMMLIRSMSPDILIVDEIGSEKDVEALMEAIHAGVQVICTVHGESIEELKKRPSLQPIFKQSIFQRMVILTRNNSPSKVTHIYDAYGKNLIKKSRCLKGEMDWSASFP